MQITASTYALVATGGALGSVARLALSDFISRRLGEALPWGTILVNVLGSLVIGVLGAITLPTARFSPETRTWITQFLMIGICGGFTTFSSFSLQTFKLLQKGDWLLAGGNIFLSVLLCLVATALGFGLGTWFSGARTP